ncbi:DUF3871 family protein [Patiriisocius sp. Uisw_017]|uniref:DUF3871 family protein n=1 Tax=Patiriisocius sp. Uisw_017 TaxID=3230968 RepID=UPI0039E80BFE
METQLIPKSRLELVPVRQQDSIQNRMQVPAVTVAKKNPFIEANTKSVSLSHLQQDCIIPVFSKDNERTISHQEFIEVAQQCVANVFPNHSLEMPEIRTSHNIKGRIPSAIYKSAKDLLNHEKTTYYERMAFIIRVPSITKTINGNTLALMIGGVRSYNRENLYSKKSVEKFQVFIGFQNLICCNLCISTDGFSSEMRVGSVNELAGKVQDLMMGYDAEKHLKQLETLSEYSLTESQFAQMIGKAKLYNYISKENKANIPELLLNDGQVSTIAKDFYQDERFCMNDGNINLWNVYNLFTSANKSSYIDTFSDRNVNAFEFTNGLAQTLNGESNYHWFLS